MAISSFFAPSTNRTEFPSPVLPGMGNSQAQFGLEGGDVRCLQALGTLGDIEFNRLPLGE
jgi:hypothetical protein